jgi:hypothetical protein
MTLTRRSHIVRIGIGPPPQAYYIDMEVLDAVSFRTTGDKEMVLNLPATDADPYIVDDTGDNNQKTPSVVTATRRSHMKRITGAPDDTEFVDVEVLDGVAFRDDSGKEWVMYLPDDDNLDVYNTTTGQGDISSTRRVHDEQLYSDPTDKTSASITVERCDTMCFRSTGGEEMVIVMPSSDDGVDPGALTNGGDVQRADTVTTPPDYDPNGTTVVPPPNTDPDIYAIFPPGSKGPPTGDSGSDKTKNPKIACGPLWWPRGISKKSGPWYWYIPVQTTMTYSITHTPGKYDWVGDPTSSSWAGTPSTLTLVYAPGFFFTGADGNDEFHAYSPWGWPTLDAAILGGIDGLDWGLVDYDDTRIDDNQPNGLNATPCIPGVSGDPDIWQITGIKAPDLIKPIPPAIKWSPGSISPALAKQVALAWLQQWNATSTNFNSMHAGLAGIYTGHYYFITWPVGVDNGGTQRFGGAGEAKIVPYASTSFHVPLWDLTVFPALTGGRYIGGLPGDFWSPVTSFTDPNDGSTHDVQEGAMDYYAEILGVTQLDPKKWDTSKPESPKLKGT